MAPPRDGGFLSHGGYPQSSSILHGSLNVPIFHITQPLGIWSIMATILGDVQYIQNGTGTTPCLMLVWLMVGIMTFPIYGRIDDGNLTLLIIYS